METAALYIEIGYFQWRMDPISKGMGKDIIERKVNHSGRDKLSLNKSQIDKFQKRTCFCVKLVGEIDIIWDIQSGWDATKSETFSASPFVGQKLVMQPHTYVRRCRVMRSSTVFLENVTSKLGRFKFSSEKETFFF